MRSEEILTSGFSWDRRDVLAWIYLALFDADLSANPVCGADRRMDVRQRGKKETVWRTLMTEDIIVAGAVCGEARLAVERCLALDVETCPHIREEARTQTYCNLDRSGASSSFM